MTEATIETKPNTDAGAVVNKRSTQTPTRLIWNYAVPALVISAGYLLAAPWLVAKGLDPFTAFVLSALPWFALVIAHVAREGRRGGAWRLDRLTPFSSRLPGLRTIPICLAALVLMFGLYTLGNYLVTPLSDWVQTWLPAWHFDNRHTQKLMAEALAERGTLNLLVLLVSVNLFIGVLMPVLEELYFTGVLLPQVIERWGRLGIAIHTVLFSAYHLFSLWLLPVRILSIWPLFALAYRYRSIKLTILVHCSLNLLGGLGITMAVLKAL
jgi:membrane protease YdiL (CAAX protease family)